MMTKMKQLAFIACLTLGLLLGLSAPLRADMLIKQKTHTDAFKNQPAKDQMMQTWFSKAGIRMDMGEDKSNIVRLDQKVMYMLNHADKTYMELPLDFNKMAEKATEGDDSEQAKKVNSMMKGLMGGMMKFDVKVTDTGETQKIKSWTCHKYLVKMNMSMMSASSEVWASEDIKADYKAYYAATYAQYASQEGFKDMLAEMQKVKGVHVLSTTTTKVMGSTVKSSVELLEITDKTAPGGYFEIPADYKKKNFKGR